MTFNNVTDALRRWCEETCKTAYDCFSGLEALDYRETPSYLSYLAAADLGFRLGNLTDAEFENYADYRSAVCSLLPVSVAPSLHRELKPTERYHILEVEKAFLEKLSSLPLDCAAPDIPYFRILPESEALYVKAQLREKWNCDENSYWYPLSNVDPRDREAFFIPADVLEPYTDAVHALLGLPEQHLYCLSEREFDRPNCFEVAEIVGYDGTENIYTDKDFSSVVYCSHENTVTFAGAIVPAVKTLLMKEQAHFDRWELP